jgi:hypothetical protein
MKSWIHIIPANFSIDVSFELLVAPTGMPQLHLQAGPLDQELQGNRRRTEIILEG